MRKRSVNAADRKPLYLNEKENYNEEATLGP